jgi:hypothetical protein
MKKIISILLLFLVFIAKSQSQDSLGHGKLDVGYTFSPDYSYRTLKSNASNEWIKDTYDTLEVSKYGYTTGLNIVLHINKKLSLNSGLLFSDKGERTKKYPIQPINNYVNHFYYLDIPLKVNYNLGHKKYYYSKAKKTKLFLSGGLSANIYLTSRTVTETDNGSEKKSIATRPNLSRLNLSAIAGLGITCPLTNRWYFQLEANYRRSIISIANSSLKKYFYSYGLNLGLFYRI